jgi:hypothetical protein
VGPAPEDLGADRRARASGLACAKCYPRSEPFDLNRTEGTRPGGNRWLRAAPLPSAVVRSPELRLARARWLRGRRSWAERERAPRRTRDGNGYPRPDTRWVFTPLGYVCGLNILPVGLLLGKNLHPMGKRVLERFAFTHTR